MITNYHRPKTLDEALTLLAKPNTFPLGGGTLLSSAKTDSVEVIDLQALGLDTVKKHSNNLEVGATATLQQLYESKDCPAALKTALKLEAPLNIRNMATVAGTLVSCDGRSTFATMMLAMDVKLNMMGGQSETLGIGEFLPLRPKGLITSIHIPINVKTAFEYVARTPADKPIVCAAVAQWNSGRTRLALGGYSRSPLLAMDGTEAEGFEAAASNAYHEANDEWASAEYRVDVAAVLAKRCMTAIN